MKRDAKVYYSMSNLLSQAVQNHAVKFTLKQANKAVRKKLTRMSELRDMLLAHWEHFQIAQHQREQVLEAKA